MTTKQLAKRLGLIRRSSKLSLNAKGPTSPKSKQFFDYLIIIDFESTCWKDTKQYGQEIIEFPAVLINTSNGEIESEFHTYVQPQEHPILSDFCTELTGIKQQQVDDGVPLRICLSQFNTWIQKLQKEKHVTFPGVLPTPTASEQTMCAFVTWSDWDLGVCLLYECKRKQLRKPDILNSWIDLRLTYKLFYNRRPKGLNGALQDVGIEFSGREHSGLDDSRNTARLAWRMICDGCVMKITKSLEKVPPKSTVRPGPPVAAQVHKSGQGDVRQASATVVEDGQDLKHLTSDKTKDMGSRQLYAGSNRDSMAGDRHNGAHQTKDMGSRQLYAGSIQDSMAGDRHNGAHQTKDMGSRQLYAGSIQDSMAGDRPNGAHQTLINGLCTTLGNAKKYRSSPQTSFGPIQNGRAFASRSLDHSPHGRGHLLMSTTVQTVNDVSALDMDSSSDLSILADWEEAAVIEDSQHEGPARLEEPDLLPVDSPSNAVLLLNRDQENRNRCQSMKNNRIRSVIYKSPDTTIYNVNTKKPMSNGSAFKLPSALGNRTNIPASSAGQMNKTSTLLDYFPKKKHSSVSFCSPPKKRPFTIHDDRGNRSLPVTTSGSRVFSHKLFYNRRPKGLNGALQDVGIEFSGREHSGLDDSRNTARLAWRMICDGCVMKITKSLEKVPPKSTVRPGPPVAAQVHKSGQGDVRQASATVVEDGQDLKHLTSDKTKDMGSRQLYAGSNRDSMAGDRHNGAHQTKDMGSRQLYAGSIQDSMAGDRHNGAHQTKDMGSRQLYAGSIQDSMAGDRPNGAHQTLINGLCTTLGNAKKYRSSPQTSFGPIQNGRAFASRSLDHSPHGRGHLLMSTTVQTVNDVSALDMDSSSDLSILADWEEAAVIEDSQHEGPARLEEPDLLPVDSPSNAVLLLNRDQENRNRCQSMKNNRIRSVIYKSPDTTIYNVNTKKPMSNGSAFKLPSALGNRTNIPASSAGQMNKTSTLLDYFPKKKHSSVSFCSPPKKRPFTIHDDRGNRSLPVTTSGSRVFSHKVWNSIKSERITAPTCQCGRRAKKLTVSNPGPNHGRVFYSCSVRKRNDENGKGCNYFKWEETLLKEKSAHTSAILSTSVMGTSFNKSVISAVNKPFIKLRPSLRT